MTAGIVGAVRYTHCDDAGGGGVGRDGSGGRYELVVALTRIRGQLFGEDFSELLAAGATQRASLRANLDLFCYQPPELRLNTEADGTQVPTLLVFVINPTLLD